MISDPIYLNNCANVTHYPVIGGGKHQDIHFESGNYNCELVCRLQCYGLSVDTSKYK
jgi:hypothetical protein